MPGPEYLSLSWGRQVGRAIYFAGSMDVMGDDELWMTLGRPGTTHRVADIRPGRSGSGPFWLTPLDDLVVFSARDGIHGSEVWRSDGTEEGTRLVRDINRQPR